MHPNVNKRPQNLVMFTYVYIFPPHPDLPPACPALLSGTHGI